MDKYIVSGGKSYGYFIISPLFIKQKSDMNNIILQARWFDKTIVEYFDYLKILYKENIEFRNNEFFIGYYFKNKKDAENHTKELNAAFEKFCKNYSFISQ